MAEDDRFRFRIRNLPVGTPCHLYEAKEGRSGKPYRSDLVGSDHPDGPQYGEFVDTKPGWKILQGGEHKSNTFFFKPGDDVLEFEIRNGVVVPVTDAPPKPTGLVATFGDSDTSDRSPIGPKGPCRKTTVARELASFGLETRNFAKGATPIYGWLPNDDDPSVRNYGLDQVRKAFASTKIAVAIFRFGLNDVHKDLCPPTLPGIANFRAAYEEAIRIAKNYSARVIITGLILEARNDRRPGDRAVNDTLRDLCEKQSCSFVPLGMDALADDEDYVWDHDGIHLNTRGTKRVAELLRVPVTAG